MGYIWPVDPDVYGVTQEFGNAPSNGVNPPGGHTGRDFATPIGTPVLAVGDGVIDFAGDADWTPNDNPLWMMGSTCIILNCGDSEPSFTYGHLSSVAVSAGDRVTQGQVIGYSGNSGISTGPHLHFEALPPGYVLDQWTYGRVDPRRYCNGYVTGQPSINPQSSNVTPITPQEEDMAVTDDDLKKIYNAVWFGVPGAPLIQNRREGQPPAWPETFLGSLEQRIQDQILKPALAALPAASIAEQLNAAGIAAQVRDELVKLIGGQNG
jgi:murein DD-endopeptidase MepM/ murein hydrolase activator NlpD